MRSLIIAVLVGCPIGAALAQDAIKGETLFRKCLPCHQVGEGARNKFGPQLNGLEGRRIGTAAGYRYSAGSRNSGIVWDEASFTAYIADPKAMVPGSKMAFVGIGNEAAARDLWAYLARFDADGRKR